MQTRQPKNGCLHTEAFQIMMKLSSSSLMLKTKEGPRESLALITGSSKKLDSDVNEVWQQQRQ